MYTNMYVHTPFFKEELGLLPLKDTQIYVYVCMYIHIYIWKHPPTRCRLDFGLEPGSGRPLHWKSLRSCSPSALGMYSEGPSTQLRTLVPTAIPFMLFGTRVLEYGALGPSG